jgi:hypothetical protein
MPFNYYAHFSSAVLVDQVDTFRWMNMTFPTTSEAITIIIQLRNTPLQSHFYEIKRLHPIFSDDVFSTVSQPCIFRFYANRVSVFKWINVKLQTSKLSKIGSNINVCPPLYLDQVVLGNVDVGVAAAKPWKWST